MPEIFGLPGGMAVRRLGFEPTDWHARMELRAQVVHGLEGNPAKWKQDDQAAATTVHAAAPGYFRKDVR